MDEKLKKYRLKVYESEAPDRQLVDFDIADNTDNVAWVWGDRYDDVEVECNHPTDHGCVEFGDDDEQGTCVLCGAKCDWHWEDDTGDVEDYHWEGKSRCIDEWFYPKRVGGLIKKYLEESQAQNA